MSLRITAALAALAALIALGSASGTQAAALKAATAAKPKTCAVTIDRSQPAGVFDVTRQAIAGGRQCICYIYTGPANQDPVVESKVQEIRASAMCPGARVQALAAPLKVRGSGFFGGGLSPLLGIGGFGGGVTSGITADSKPRPASP